MKSNQEIKKLNLKDIPKRKTNSSQTPFSTIAAYCYISESELFKIMQDYSSDWETKYPEAFKEILWGLGLNVDQDYKRQDAVKHRNRLGEVHICSRWVGNERQDTEWIKSGYASREALDRHKNSRLLDDVYRSKAMTVDVQDMLEQRDRYYEEKENE